MTRTRTRTPAEVLEELGAGPAIRRARDLLDDIAADLEETRRLVRELEALSAVDLTPPDGIK